jgi:hypothetical protein
MLGLAGRAAHLEAVRRMANPPPATRVIAGGAPIVEPPNKTP